MIDLYSPPLHYTDRKFWRLPRPHAWVTWDKRQPFFNNSLLFRPFLLSTPLSMKCCDYYISIVCLICSRREVSRRNQLARWFYGRSHWQQHIFWVFGEHTNWRLRFSERLSALSVRRSVNLLIGGLTFSIFLALYFCIFTFIYLFYYQF